MEGNWQKSFVDKLGKVQTLWIKQFEDTLNKFVQPAFQNVASFTRENGFKVSTPLHDDGRRSYKFELSENAYLLMIFRFSSVGEFELRCESFVPGHEPCLNKSQVRLVDVSESWVDQQFQTALDTFIDLLSGSKFRQNTEQLVEV